MKRSTFLLGSIAFAQPTDQAARMMEALRRLAEEQRMEAENAPRRARIEAAERLIEWNRRLDRLSAAIAKVRNKDVVNARELKELRRASESVLALLK